MKSAPRTSAPITVSALRGHRGSHFPAELASATTSLRKAFIHPLASSDQPMNSLSIVTMRNDQAGRSPVPFPTPHSQVAGSSLQPTYELFGKGGTPQNQLRF